MKIMILANNDIGLYKFRKELVEALLTQYEVCICLPYGAYVEKLARMGCEFIPYEFDRHGTNPVNELRLMRFYKKILKKARPDLVFTYTIKPNVYGGMACASLGIPYVANVTGLGMAIENGGAMQKLTLALYKYGLRKARRVFFQNESNAAFLQHAIKLKAKSTILPGSGVNLQQYQVLDFPDGETVDFVFIARVMKEKGIEEYLEAAEHIRNQYPNTRFHICGEYEENYKAKLEDLQQRGIVIYHGLVHDITEIHRISQCTIHPTYHEGLSNVLLESCACGRPVIATDCPGCSEVVEDGVNGFLVKLKDSDDLIKNIQKFLSMSVDERMAMGIAGRKKVEKEFDRNIVIENYMNEVKQIENLAE